MMYLFSRLSPNWRRIFKQDSTLQLTLVRKIAQMNIQCVFASASENAKYFKSDSTPAGKALHSHFLLLASQCQQATPLLEKINQEAPKYDIDTETPGNGYRSFLAIYEALFKKCSTLCETVKRDRGKFIFNLQKFTHLQDLKAWNDVLSSLYIFLEHLCTLIEWTANDNNPCLFPSSKHSSHELLDKAKSIDSQIFYGRHAAFQFCPSIENILKGLLTIMASYSDYYFSNSSHVWRVAKSLFMGTQYTLDAEHRARRIVNASQYATIDFLKSFWFLAESDLMKKVPDQLCPPIRVNQLILIPPEPINLVSTLNTAVNIPLPTAHGPTAPVQVRLMSAKSRPGMPVQNGYAEASVSDSLIIHCHGGGFVSQSSQSHETYLRQWAVMLDVPILSIDYSLAPEFPFPRQLQEILYVYAWVLKNPSMTGTTAKKIVFVGDSAGANLVLGTALWISELRLRQPDGLFLAYVPLLVKFVPSPSRLLCLTDPLLPFGFMMRCLNAYTGSEEKIEKVNDEKSAIDQHRESHVSEHAKEHNTVEDAELLDLLIPHSPVEELDLFHVPSSPLMSPFLASDSALKKLPPIRLMSPELDSCLDDSVEFSKRCRKLGCDVHLDILPGLSHGFLNFALLSPEAKEASILCVQRIKQLLDTAGEKNSGNN